jgi:hypothetical protein
VAVHNVEIGGIACLARVVVSAGGGKGARVVVVAHTHLLGDEVCDLHPAWCTTLHDKTSYHALEISFTIKESVFDKTNEVGSMQRGVLIKLELYDAEFGRNSDVIFWVGSAIRLENAYYLVLIDGVLRAPKG